MRRAERILYRKRDGLAPAIGCTPRVGGLARLAPCLKMAPPHPSFISNDRLPESADLNRQEPCVRPEEVIALKAYRYARRLVVALVGGTIVVAGLVMLVTPGPAMVLIPAGLAILAIEFAWARRLLKRSRRAVAELGIRGVRRGQPRADAGVAPVEQEQHARKHDAEPANDEQGLA